jgi:hypothetical protein
MSEKKRFEEKIDNVEALPDEEQTDKVDLIIDDSYGSKLSKAPSKKSMNDFVNNLVETIKSSIEYL